LRERDAAPPTSRAIVGSWHESSTTIREGSRAAVPGADQGRHST
jgi:hypothetical protein